MVSSSRSALSGFILACMASAFCAWPAQRAGAATPNEPAAGQAQSEYRQWVDRYARKDLVGRKVGGGATEVNLKLVITAVAGEEKVRADTEFSRRSGISVFGNELTTDGVVQGFSHTDFGSKGSGGDKPLPVADLKRVDELLAKLPDDGARLPPPGRRMLLQAAAGDGMAIRVYDLANAPEEVWEILRLSRCGIRSWLPEFKPQSEIDACRFQQGGFLCLSPDGKQILFASTNGPLQFWEPATHELLAENVRPGVRVSGEEIFFDGITFSADGSQAVIAGFGRCAVMDTKTWKRTRGLEEPLIGRHQNALFSPRFTPDGRYLLLECTEPALRIFDAKTWERVDKLPEVPEDAVQYVPAPKIKRALVRSKEGAVLLWDTEQHRMIAKLDESAYISAAAFAPDESLVAVATAQKLEYVHYWGGCRIRIWKTETGELVRELRPYESRTTESVEGLMWPPDGQYILAGTKSDSFFTSRGISVFNVKSARHRGEFVGCGTNVNGIALLPGGDQLVAGCHDGKIRFWNFREALKAIRDFEASLNSSSKQ